MRIVRSIFTPVVGAAIIYLATHEITPRWPTLIVGFAVLAIGWRFLDRAPK